MKYLPAILGWIAALVFGIIALNIHTSCTEWQAMWANCSDPTPYVVLCVLSGIVALVTTLVVLPAAKGSRKDLETPKN